MKSLEPVSKKSKKKQCIVRYAGLGPYSELKDVNEEKEAGIRAAIAKRQTLKGRNHHEEQCLLVPDKIQDATHRVLMTPCYKKFWLVNHQETRITCGCQREVSMVIQLGFIQRFAVSVRKDVCHIEGRKWVLQNWR